MDIDEILRIFVGIAFLLVPAYVWWEQWRTSRWPTTRARVIEIEPQSLFERDVDTYYLKLDSDYAIEYEVNGHRYVQTPNIESNVRLGGLKIARTPGVPREFQIRYNARNPSKYSIMHAYSRPLLWGVSLVCFAAGLFALTLGA